jgi:Tfp pilus assembly protein PilN
MATTFIPEVTDPEPSASGGARFVAIRADLMPEDVISARQGDVVRRKVLVALVVVVALLVGGYGFSWWQTRSARSDLGSLQRQNVTLQDQQNQFAPLVEAQNNVQSIQTQLQQLMTGDLSWKDLLGRLRSSAPSGVSVTSVAASETASTAGASTTAVPSLNPGGATVVGSATLTGSAANKNAVAAYADRLAAAKGLASPLITSVAAGGTGSSVTFTIQVNITSDALGGRFSAPSASSTGGH